MLLNKEIPLKSIRSILITLALLSMIGCASRPATVQQPAPDDSRKKITVKPTPRFKALNDAVNYMGASVAQEFSRTSVGAADQQTVVAVADFVTVEGKVTQLGRVISDKFIPVLMQSKKFSVLERTLIDKVLDEQQFQLSPFSDEDSAAEFGKILGAEAIITGTISDLGDVFYLNTRVIDVTRGNLVTSTDAELVKKYQWVTLYHSDLPHLNKPKIKTRVFRAQGVGIPSSKLQNPTQARLMALRAAKGDALRNLAEEIKGTRIDSDTTIEDMVTQNDNIRMQLNTTLQGARVVNRKQMPDGSVEIEIEVELPEDLVDALFSQ